MDAPNYIVDSEGNFYLDKDEAPSLPPLANQAKNFVTASAKHMWAGMKKANEEEKAKRWAKCSECDKLIDGKRCSLCGCFMKIKSTWAEQSCPLRRW